MRITFCAVASGKQAPARAKTALRNRAKATLAEEAAALDKVLHDAQRGGVVIIPRLKAQIEAALGKTMALSGIYRMLHRHQWRKLAPDTQHPKGDPLAREVWKKTPRIHQGHLSELRTRTAAAPDVSGRSALWANQRLLLLLVQETGASDGQGDVEPPVRVRLRRSQPA